MDAATLLWLAACAGVGGTGYWLGRRHLRTAVEAERERMSRILDYPERGSEPHNWSSPPARVSQGKIRNRRRWDVQGGRVARK